MGEVNLDRLRELAAEIRRALTQLSELSQIEEASFLKDPRAVNSVKYLLIVITEAAIDICNHLSAKKGGRAPQDYSDCFTILSEIGIISHDLAHRLARMAKFRNLLVHLYWKVDDREVYKYIQRNLGDLDEYLKAIGIYLGYKI